MSKKKEFGHYAMHTLMIMVFADCVKVLSMQTTLNFKSEIKNMLFWL